jgi:hypothetical protein
MKETSKKKEVYFYFSVFNHAKSREKRKPFCHKVLSRKKK